MIPFKVQVNTIYVCSCMSEYVSLYCDLSESQCDYHEFNGELIKVPWSLKRVKEVIDEVSPSLSLSLAVLLILKFQYLCILVRALLYESVIYIFLQYK